MNELLHIVLAGIAGLILGSFFYGGLWYTVKKGVTHKNPAWWFLGSLVLRTGVTLIGFYFVSQGDLKRMLVCLAAFIVARIIVTRLTRLPNEISHEN